MYINNFIPLYLKKMHYWPRVRNILSFWNKWGTFVRRVYHYVICEMLSAFVLVIVEFSDLICKYAKVGSVINPCAAASGYWQNHVDSSFSHKSLVASLQCSSTNFTDYTVYILKCEACIVEDQYRQFSSYRMYDLHALTTKYECFTLSSNYIILCCTAEIRHFISVCNISVLHKDFNKSQPRFQALQGYTFGGNMVEIRRNVIFFILASTRSIVNTSRSDNSLFLVKIYPTHIY